MSSEITESVSGFVGSDMTIAVLAGLVAVASVMFVWFGLIEPQQMKTRLKSMQERRQKIQKLQLELQEGGGYGNNSGHPMRQRGMQIATGVVNKLELIKGSQAKKVADKLAQGGWRDRDAVIWYLFGKVALPIVALVLGVFFIYIAPLMELKPMLKPLILLGVVVMGAYGPEMVVRNASQKRRKLLVKGLPDALDLMVICAEAGLSMDATMDRVGRELKQPWPELSDEIGHTSIELGFLPERRAALENFHRRTGMPAVKALINTLLQSERYGTPLAQALRVLAAELRTNRLMAAEEKAARLPAILTVPMILFILPALFVVLIGPAVIRVMGQMTTLAG